jgi:hypothetical protein
MGYTTKGSFILGKLRVGEAEVYYPIFEKNGDTIYMGGREYVRIKNDAKP